MRNCHSNLAPEQIAALRRGAAVSEWDRKQAERVLVAVALAINDEDGNPSGRVRAIDVQDRRALDSHLKLESRYWNWGPVCYVRCDRVAGIHQLQLGRRRFPILGHKTWYGNWCWDAVLVTAWTAAEVFNWLRLQGYWRPDVGNAEMWAKWERGEPFKWGDFAGPGVGRVRKAAVG